MSQRPPGPPSREDVPPPSGPPGEGPGAGGWGAEPAKPRPVAPRRLVLGAVASGLLASLLLPGEEPGVNMLIVAVAVTASVAAVRPRRITGELVVFGALGLALAGVSVLRSAPWVVGIAALVALGLASVLVVGASSWRTVLGAPLAVAARALPGVAFLWRGARRLRGSVHRPSPALRGAALAGALVLVFGALFVSADRAFAHLASKALIPDWDLSLILARAVTFALAFSMVGAYAAASPRFASPLRIGLWESALDDERRAPRRLGRTEWAVALTALDLLFAAFVVLQIAVLFGGHTHVLETAGLTYAEYARQGFFQLLAVGGLTLAVVAGAVRWAARAGARETLLLKVLLGLLCALTLVVLASALRRLGLYEEAFGFTRARLAAHAVILWLAGLLVLVMVAGARMRGWWLPRAAVGFTAVAVLAFSLADPDGLVASRNVERYRDTGRIDLGYMAALSPDAVPALATLPAGLRECVLFAPWGIADRLAEPEPWYAWNLGRAQARSVLAELPPADDDRYARHPAAAPVQDPCREASP